jgi:hypothetical protein
MKVRLSPLLLLAALFFVACSDDDKSTPVNPVTNVNITGMVPITGPAGTIITVRGSNFGTDPSEMKITFGALSITPLSLTDTEIKFMVPLELAKGPTTIEIQRGTGKKASIQFTVEDPVVGIWISQGKDNIAPILYDAPFNIRKIVATFKADGSYLVVQTDSNNVTVTMTGSYVAEPGGAAPPNDRIRTISVLHAPPASFTAEGIYEVSIDQTNVSMRFEVVQTEPPLAGISKPTPQAGFGSTAGGLLGQRNVQKYARQ